MLMSLQGDSTTYNIFLYKLIRRLFFKANVNLNLFTKLGKSEIATATEILQQLSQKLLLEKW